jgi:hypothetical protein
MSLIQNILDDTVMKRERGLDYAAYAVTGDARADCEARLEVLYRSRSEQLDELLEKFACETPSGTRTATQQVDLWEKLLPRVHEALRALDWDFVRTGQGENVRVVFDLDMGGLYYTRLGSHAVLFGATLDQEEVNNGRCERDMYRMVSQIETVCTSYGA